MPDFTDILNAIVLLSNFVLIPALTYGSQLALGALGITLIYSILRFSNFAHGDLMAFGTMLVILITWWFQSMGIGFGVLPTALLALPLAIVGAIALSLLFDKSVYQFYRQKKSPPVIFVIVSTGVMFVMNAIVRFIIGPDDQRFMDGVKFIFRPREFKVFTGLNEGLALKSTQVLTVAITLIAVAALFYFLQKTR
ncbi:MAG: branched-chain amino acid ABC transporter permease, partial [Gammaproteobacteria bacterium]|nr:branched-chain amino acid ABC transporter permease [Gammaproteobacteria bacterium]